MTQIGIFLLWLLHFLPFGVLARLGEVAGMLFYALGRDQAHRGISAGIGLQPPEGPGR